jgi:hypothetical protein
MRKLQICENLERSQKFLKKWHFLAKRVKTFIKNANFFLIFFLLKKNFKGGGDTLIDFCLSKTKLKKLLLKINITYD